MSDSKKVNTKKPFKTQLTADFMMKIVEIVKKHTNRYENTYEAPAKVIIECILIDALEAATNNYCVLETIWRLKSNQIKNITSALEGLRYVVKIEKDSIDDKLYVITVRWSDEND